MSTYTVKFYSGDYSARQRAANRDKAIVYVEGHANSAESATADYAMAVVASNHSDKSMQMAREFAAACGTLFDVGGDKDRDVYGSTGVRVGGRGDGNLSRTDMPAVLLEPVFGSNPKQAAIAETDDGLNRLAGVINALVRRHFPAGGLVAFSIGHIGKTNAPKDRGAAWKGKRFANEAAYATEYLNRASALLQSGNKQ